MAAMQEQEMTISADAAPQPVSFTEALRFWLKLGFISFGGPAGQIAVMHQELVERRRWISERRFLHALNYCMLLPGPEAQQLATYIGWLMHGVRGGIVAGALFVLPSLFILIALSWIYLVWGEVSWVAGFFYGIKPAVVAIVLFAAWRIGARALKNALLWLIAAAAFVAIFVLKVPFPAIILGAGLLGIVGGRFLPERFQIGTGHSVTTGTMHPPALIDDHTPTPAHAVFAWPRLAAYLSVGLGLWLAAFSVLLVLYGWQSVLAQMGRFFSKAALLTFGGAYAVLPYVFQGAVEQHGWLTATQMIDGLALGETTPGPLIMVVAFVGFVGAWTAQVLGPQLVLAGVAGACVATFFTFLPSFLFILLGGPLVEATHGDLKFTAPLTAITAAVVGVILNLALFFAWHVLWPAGFDGGFEWISACIGVLAFIALWRFRIGVIPVIAACALAGFALSWLNT
jgi:chromate transporter